MPSQLVLQTRDFQTATNAAVLMHTAVRDMEVITALHAHNSHSDVNSLTVYHVPAGATFTPATPEPAYAVDTALAMAAAASSQILSAPIYMNRGDSIYIIATVTAKIAVVLAIDAYEEVADTRDAYPLLLPQSSVLHIHQLATTSAAVAAMGPNSDTSLPTDYGVLKRLSVFNADAANANTASLWVVPAGVVVSGDPDLAYKICAVSVAALANVDLINFDLPLLKGDRIFIKSSAADDLRFQGQILPIDSAA